ncbi:MAG TPA: PQQ-dependent sugar dehydrogenase [Dongiaceae bacterium]|nr:PQQ-dependent sugar dehydrogenase [Dongiaceae bacterium]
MKVTTLLAVAVWVTAFNLSPVRGQDVCSGTAPVPNAQLASFPVVTGLTRRPLLVTAPPGDRDRLFIVEQDGLIRIHHRGAAAGTVVDFLDITDRVQAAATFNEMGLLGLAFDTDYDQSGFFYVNYTAGPIGGPWSTVVSRFSRSTTDPDVAEPDSEEILLTFAQPQTNHNGGQLMFGADGFLYIATGDGGSGGDPHGTCGNGENRNVLLGKMLRLDVRDRDPQSLPPDCGGAGAPYRVPSTNPFASAGAAACGEIWLYGLRNPWRSAFDPANGDLYVADVGQDCYEEVNVLPGIGQAGANLGWRSMEGLHCFAPGPTNCNPAPVTCAGTPTCGDPTLVLPLVEYDHSQGCSITGGPVYRGCQMPGWLGTYFYGDFCSGFIRSFRMAGGVLQEAADRTGDLDPAHTLTNSLTSFGLDGQGEIYIVDRDGSVRRIGPRFIDLEVSAPGDAAPLRLDFPAWTWGDLAFSSMRSIDRYRVYRGTPGGPFQCRFTSPTPQWTGGDPTTPAIGTYFAYVVTAVAPTGEETRPGVAGSFTLGSCP